jgi:hypothetical protein
MFPEHRIAQSEQLQSLVGEGHGFGFVGRVLGQTLAVKPIERVPIKTRPGAIAVMQRQRQQRQRKIFATVSRASARAI